MQKQFVTYEIALKLKELGFDEQCFGYYYIDKTFATTYNIDMYNPLLNSNIKEQQKHSFELEIMCVAPLWQQVIPFINKTLLNKGYENYNDCYLRTDFSDLEQLEKAILKSIELCKNK